MHRHVVSLFLICIFILSPLAAQADTTQNVDSVRQGMLTAILNYVERSFGLLKERALSDTDLRNSIQSGANWLVQSADTNGHFAYEYVPYDGIYNHDDNIVRQAGSLYALGEVVRKDPTDNSARDTVMERSIAYFAPLSKKDTAYGKTFKCVADNARSSQCQLGTTSLVLVGILDYIDRHPDAAATYADRIRDYVNYVLAMKKDGAGFRNFYYVGNGLQQGDESSYGNGEALLALARYYTYHPDPAVKATIDAAFTYFKNAPYDVPLYLWVMTALKDMYDLWPQNAYIEYARGYTKWRLESVARYKGTTQNFCAYSEGIVDAYSVIAHGGDAAELTSLRREIDYWNWQSSLLQLTSADMYRVVSGSSTLAMKMLPKPELALGGFLTGQNDLTERIDYTQHCVGAALGTLTDIDGQSL